MQGQQQLRLLGVVFVGIHRADGLAVVDDRRGRAAFERLVRKFGVEDILPAKRLHQLRIKGVAADRAVSLARVVQHAARGVCHKHAGDPRLLHERHRTRDIFLAQLFKARKRRHHHGDAALQRALLRAERQVFRRDERIRVQQDQHRQNDGDIAEAEFSLQARMHLHGAAPLLFLLVGNQSFK